MKKALFKLVIIFTSYLSIEASAQDFIWAKAMGGINFDAGNSIVTDNIGNTYTTGFFEKKVDFDPGTGTYELNSAGMQDIFIMKMDSSGRLVWVKDVGGVGGDEGLCIALDAQYNLLIAGNYEGTVDFDPGIGIAKLDSNGLFITKFDTSGNFIWVDRIAPIWGGRINCITSDVACNVYVTGGYTGTCDFDPGVGVYNLTSMNPYPSAITDIFILKLDKSGNFKWAKSIGSNYHDISNSIAVDLKGNVYSTGFYSDTCDFDPGVSKFYLNTSHEESAFILKLDSFGNFIWAKGLMATNGWVSYGESIAVDDSANIYITGLAGEGTDLDPGPAKYILDSAGIFILKLDEFGNFIWASGYGGRQGLAHGRFITLSKSHHVYLSGYLKDSITIKLDTGIFQVNRKSYSSLIFKFSSSGHLLWVESLESSLQTSVFSMTVDSSENLYLTGRFIDTCDLDPGPLIHQEISTSKERSDIFILRLGNTYKTKAMDPKMGVKLFPNPSYSNVSLEVDASYMDSYFSIADIAGKVLMDGVIHELRTEIDISNFVSGFYFVRLGKKGMKVLKFIKL